MMRNAVTDPAGGGGGIAVTGVTGAAGATDAGRGIAAPPRPDEFAQMLALLGETVTSARRAIAETLLEAGRLETPEALLRGARGRAPRTSLATVYRTLDRLDAAGALKRATLASGEVGYAYCPSGHHEHAICLGCGRLEPVRPCVLIETPAVPGFRIRSHLLDFYGLCDACARSTAGGSEVPPAGSEAGGTSA